MNSPKLKTIISVIVLLSGLAFLVFAFFFNRATLSITAETPFSINLVGITSRSCDKSPCTITAAPGHYQLKLRKDQFFEISEEIDLPLGQTIEKKYTFKQLPSLKLTGAKFSIDPARVFFVADSPDKSRPTLYQQDSLLSDLESSPDASKATPLLYFTRSIKRSIIAASPSKEKLALIDQTEPATQSLYLLDLQAKSRQALEQNQQYYGAKWLNDQTLLVQRRNLTTIVDELYLYKDLTQSQSSNIDTSSTPVGLTPIALDIISGVDLISPLDQNHFIYAQPFPKLEDGTRPTGFLIYSYDLSTGQSQELFSNTDLSLPTRLEYLPGEKVIYLEIDKNIYSLGPI